MLLNSWRHLSEGPEVRLSPQRWRSLWRLKDVPSGQGTPALNSMHQNKCSVHSLVCGTGDPKTDVNAPAPQDLTKRPVRKTDRSLVT